MAERVGQKIKMLSMQAMIQITGGSTCTATEEYNRRHFMYEKLDKLRAEVTRWEQKIEDDKAKLKQAQERLKEAEHSQIIADVGALNLSPEQLAEFLKLVTAGKSEAVNTSVGNSYRSTVTESEYEDEEDKETEDFDDEEN